MLGGLPSVELLAAIAIFPNAPGVTDRILLTSAKCKSFHREGHEEDLE
jgi:hypothetical protein